MPDSINQEVPKYGDTFKTNVTFGYRDDHEMPKKKLKFRYRKVSVNYPNSHTKSRQYMPIGCTTKNLRL